MKRILFLIMFLFVCSAVFGAGYFVLGIDIAGGFKGENVKVFLDDKQVFEVKKAVDDHIISLAGQTEVKVIKDKNMWLHQLRFYVNGKLFLTSYIIIEKDTYVSFALDLDKERKPVFMIQNEPYYYD